MMAGVCGLFNFPTFRVLPDLWYSREASAVVLYLQVDRTCVWISQACICGFVLAVLGNSRAQETDINTT